MPAASPTRSRRTRSTTPTVRRRRADATRRSGRRLRPGCSSTRPHPPGCRSKLRHRRSPPRREPSVSVPVRRRVPLPHCGDLRSVFRCAGGGDTFEERAALRAPNSIRANASNVRIAPARVLASRNSRNGSWRWRTSRSSKAVLVARGGYSTSASPSKSMRPWRVSSRVGGGSSRAFLPRAFQS